MSSTIYYLFYPGFPLFRILFNRIFHKEAFINSENNYVIAVFYSEIRTVNWPVHDGVFLIKLKYLGKILDGMMNKKLLISKS
jgi:hypothetical protein